jgi:hypothetical protein
LGEHYVVGFTLSYQGLALLDLGRRRAAIPKLDRALALVPPGEPDRAHAAFALARALEPGRPRSARTRALAEEALQIFTAIRATRERSRVTRYLTNGRLAVSTRR